MVRRLPIRWGMLCRWYKSVSDWMTFVRLRPFQKTSINAVRLSWCTWFPIPMVAQCRTLQFARARHGCYTLALIVIYCLLRFGFSLICQFVAAYNFLIVVYKYTFTAPAAKIAAHCSKFRFVVFKYNLELGSRQMKNKAPGSDLKLSTESLLNFHNRSNSSRNIRAGQ